MFQRSSSRQVKGTRMRSNRPKPLHLICGRAMVLHVIHSLELLHPDRTALVVGHGAEQVTKKVQQLAPAWSNIAFVEQVEQNGTGDAAAIGMTAFPGDDYDEGEATIVVLPGDTPLLRPETLLDLVEAHVANRNAATLLTSVVDDPTGYGRVIRKNDGQAQRIVEHRDATPDELDVKEICTSIYAFRRDLLGPALRKLTTDNAQGEYYLTDVISVLAQMGHRIGVRPGTGRRDPGRQRPLAAGARRTRTAGAHQPSLAAPRRDDARPAPDLHRRHGEDRPRRHGLPGHDAAGHHGRRRRLRTRSRHPPRRLQRRCRGDRRAHRRPSIPRSGRARSSGRTPICLQVPRSLRPRRPGRSTLHPSGERRPHLQGSSHIHGKGHDQAARPLLGADAP